MLLRSSDAASRTLSPRSTPTPVVIDPLPAVQRNGLIAVAILAVVSLVSVLSLLCFITYRLVFWRKDLQYNQYIILIYNLLLADLQQAIAFLICFYWVAKNSIHSPSVACFLQGFWLQIGDPSSGLFVLAIAAHTFLLVTQGRKMEHWIFVACVVGIWAFVALLVIVPAASHGEDIFVPSGAWCWINERYETDRLWTHYIWIFLAEFGTVALYAIMFIQLRRRITQSAILGSQHTESLQRLKRVIGYMIIYPFAYVVLSLPLAAGRMATARGNNPSMAYFCVSGALMTCSGFVDVLMYTLTRKNLLIESEPSADRSYNNIFSNKRKSNPLTTLTGVDNKATRTDITALRRGSSDSSHGGRDGSTDNIVQKGVELAPMGHVYQHTTIEVTHEPAYPDDFISERSSKDSPRNGHKGSPSNPSRLWRD
ncbi:hypothetical protein VTN00DRAFT_3200 [Thermoascus crustaceus]|uniref:uncharacterized protein n=1 Tax=Thermoascus crustaceus TaxID=5088 RepID=UPI003742AD1B